MDPIDVRTETTFSQALRCAQFRLPRSDGYRAPGYVLALGIRYGMIGMAAGHHLLLSADEDEEQRVFAMMETWSSFVEDHVRWEIAHRVPFPINGNMPHVIGRVSSLPILAYAPLYKRLCPLSRALEIVGDAVVAENRAMIFEGWSWFRRRTAMRLFIETLSETQEFAINFFERRQADLDEVPEIALIGE